MPVQPTAGIPPAETLSPKPAAGNRPTLVPLTPPILSDDPDSSGFMPLVQLLAIGVILLVITLFFLGLPSFFKGKPGPAADLPDYALASLYNSAKEGAETQGLGGITYERYVENLEKILGEKDDAKKVELLAENFDILSSQYLASHDPKTRELALSVANYVKDNFPDQFAKNADKFEIACYDTSCGTANYPSEIEELKKELQAIDSLDKQVLASILRNFEAAAISTDKNSQWADYLNSLSSLKGEYDRTNNDQIKLAHQKLKEFMQKNHPGRGFPPQVVI